MLRQAAFVCLLLAAPARAYFQVVEAASGRLQFASAPFALVSELFASHRCAAVCRMLRNVSRLFPLVAKCLAAVRALEVADLFVNDFDMPNEITLVTRVATTGFTFKSAARCP